MILGSHNSWSYLPVKQWYFTPFAFTARCQSIDIRTQYEKYGVRCFDLRVRFDKNTGIVYSIVLPTNYYVFSVNPIFDT